MSQTQRRLHSKPACPSTTPFCPPPHSTPTPATAQSLHVGCALCLEHSSSRWPCGSCPPLLQVPVQTTPRDIPRLPTCSRKPLASPSLCRGLFYPPLGHTPLSFMVFSPQCISGGFPQPLPLLTYAPLSQQDSATSGRRGPPGRWLVIHCSRRGRGLREGQAHQQHRDPPGRSAWPSAAEAAQPSWR